MKELNENFADLTNNDYEENKHIEILGRKIYHPTCKRFGLDIFSRTL